MSEQPDQSPAFLPEEVAPPAALLRLRAAIQAQRDLPSEGVAGPRLAALAAAADVRTQDLTEVAFADPALVLRLLRIANGSSYGTRDRNEVVSVGRAVALLGHEQVGSLCRSLPDVKSRVPGNRLAMVRAEIAQATFASRFTRNLLDTRNPMVSEEGAVATVCMHLPNILMSMHTHHERCALRFVQRTVPRQLEPIERELIGLTPERLGREIVESWGLPRGALRIIAQLEHRPQTVIAGRDWLPIAVGIGSEVARIVRLPNRSRRDTALLQLIRRYAQCIDLDAQRLQALIEESATEALTLERNFGMSQNESALAAILLPYLRREDSEEPWWEPLEATDATGVIARLRNRALSHGVMPGQGTEDPTARNAAGKPLDASRRLDTLREQIERAANAYLAAERDGEFVHSTDTAIERLETRILPMIMEGMRAALGYEHVTWLAPEGEQAALRPRLTAGINLELLRGICSAPLAQEDLFSAALRNRVDLHIADCTVDKIRSRMPSWFESGWSSTRSFVLLPVPVNPERPGLLVAARHCTDPDGLTDHELRALRDLRDQFTRLVRECEPLIFDTP